MEEFLRGLDRNGVLFDALVLEKELVENAPLQGEHRFPEFSGSFYVRGYPSLAALVRRLPGAGRVARFVVDVVHLTACLHRLRRGNYDLVYVDRVNVRLAAALSWIFRRRVVLRLNGVESLYERFERPSMKFSHPFQYWSFRAPFAHIICNEDGSPCSEFMERFMRSDVPKTIWLNGARRRESGPSRSDIRAQMGVGEESLLVLFVGRLERHKGPQILLDSLTRLAAGTERSLHAVIAGDGGERSRLEGWSREHGLADRVVFEGAITNERVWELLRAADVFVSLNLLGNLSNSAIEAISAGRCFVSLGSPSSRNRGAVRDRATEKLLGDVAIWVDSDNPVDSLRDTLNDLMRRPEEVERRAIMTRQLADSVLTSWETRIDKEFDLLRAVANR